MTTNSTEELFVEGVQELYYIEQELVDALETLADGTENEDASRAFSEHREETQDHVDRLERVFESIDEEPEAKEDRVAAALIDEHEEFAGENDGEVLDRYNLEVGQKTEHYEIAAYGNAASLADTLGYEDAGDLLHETLEEEEDALDEVTRISDQFDEQQVASD